jgi:hypothetical protein
MIDKRVFELWLDLIALFKPDLLKGQVAKEQFCIIWVASASAKRG